MQRFNHQASTVYRNVLWTTLLSIAMASNSQAQQDPLLISGLRNFDVYSPPDLDLNDFHIKLQGVPASEIAGVYNPLPPWFPSGWGSHPPMPMGNDTLVSWGPGDWIGPNTKLHFGVTLTPTGEENLQGMCMNWTQDGEPVFSGDDPTLPIVIFPDVTKEPLIINQECPEHDDDPGVLLGPVSVVNLDRSVLLEELLAGDMALSDGRTVIDGSTSLDATGSLAVPESGNARGHYEDGDSLVVWFDVFEDLDGQPGRILGTSYNGFNFTAPAITVEGDFDSNGVVNGEDFLVWQSNFGLASGATLSDGDADADGDVDGFDFLVWQANVGGSNARAHSPTVPEPATASMLIVAAVISASARRGRAG